MKKYRIRQTEYKGERTWYVEELRWFLIFPWWDSTVRWIHSSEKSARAEYEKLKGTKTSIIT